ncbi:hypothetical protein HaLaN_23564, partial [Haematococcus lacustris]
RRPPSRHRAVQACFWCSTHRRCCQPARSSQLQLRLSWSSKSTSWRSCSCSSCRAHKPSSPTLRLPWRPPKKTWQRPALS